jgi:outer membrane protein
MDANASILWIRSAVAFAFLISSTAGIARAQQGQNSELSLQQAAAVALEKNPLRKAALADTKSARAAIREAQSGMLPHVSFSEIATRGDDPVYVFGSKLRQQRFTAENFAPPLNRLNNPLPYGNFTSRFAGTWNLFDSFASWHGVQRAQEMNAAATHQLERTDQ